MLIGLATYLFQKGVVPALTGIDVDFPGYFTAARIVIDGQDTHCRGGLIRGPS
jgi:hypothetical protein